MAYRDSGVGLGIGERDGPREVAFLAPTAARGKTSDASDGMSGCESRGEDVASSQDGHMLSPHVENRGEDGQQEAALVDAGGLQIIERENGARMVPIIAVAPVECDHEELRAEESGYGAIGGKIGDLLRRKTGALAQADGEPKGHQKRDGDQYSVGGRVEA